MWPRHLKYHLGTPASCRRFYQWHLTVKALPWANPGPYGYSLWPSQPLTYEFGIGFVPTGQWENWWSGKWSDPTGSQNWLSLRAKVQNHLEIFQRPHFSKTLREGSRSSGFLWSLLCLWRDILLLWRQPQGWRVTLAGSPDPGLGQEAYRVEVAGWKNGEVPYSLPWRVWGPFLFINSVHVYWTLIVCQVPCLSTMILVWMSLCCWNACILVGSRQ